MHCGASCQGLRVRIPEAERPAIAARAVELGVERPFAGPYLRQNWGRCVFWDAGCRLHATWGPEAKPAVCRQFPLLDGGRAIDPACLHATPEDGAPDPRMPIPWTDLAPGEAVRTRLDTLPLVAVLDGPLIGPLPTELLRPLLTAEPTAPARDTHAGLEWRIHTIETHGLAPAADLRTLLVGGAQLLAGAGVPMGPGFAAWTRLLRTGMV